MYSFLTPSIAEFIKKHANDDVRKLALCKNSINGEELKIALQQIEGRQKAKQKIQEWANNENIVFPVTLSMEQCSSEKAAKYKQNIVGNGKSMVDLTGGFGIDFFYISKNFKTSDYVEVNNELCEIAKNNFSVLNKKCSIHNNDAESFLKSQNCIFDLIYIDPARRDANGKKTIAPSDCIPDLTTMQELLKTHAKKVLIKYSPMLDINKAISELKNITNIYVVSINNECKELLLRQDFSINNESPITITCTNIKDDIIQELKFSYDEEKACKSTLAKDVKEYLYEPNSSIMKAGAYKVISKYWDIMPLQQNSHLYTSNKMYKDFHGRIFHVKNICKINKADFAKAFPGINQANISVRNCPFKPEDIRKKLKLKEGGNTYLFATTLSDNSMVIIGGEKC